MKQLRKKTINALRKAKEIGAKSYKSFSSSGLKVKSKQRLVAMVFACCMVLLLAFLFRGQMFNLSKGGAKPKAP